MIGRQLVFVFVGHLVSCHSLLGEPNSARNEKNFNMETSPTISNSRSSRIIGGEPTNIEKFPYVVSLQTNGTVFGHDFEHFCVGNIISRKWIITAAKCCYGKKANQFHVRVGSDLYYEGGHIHEIESIEIHPEYDEMTWDYDVGLLQLSKSIIFNEKAQPVKLPKADRPIQAGTFLDIAGWGATKLLGMPSDQMNNNTVPTISQEDCKAIYGGNSMTDRMFCVFDGENGACIGDTGSPATLDGVLIGVASWSRSCAYMYPTAYARLPEMVDWIIKVTWDSSAKLGKANGIPDTVTASVLLIVFAMLAVL